MKRPWTILQGIQRQGRQVKIITGVSILFVVLLIAGFAYAATLGRNALINMDSLDKMVNTQHTSATHKSVAHNNATPTQSVPPVVAHTPATPTPVPPTPTTAPTPTPVTQAPVAPTSQPVSGSYTDMIYQVFGSTYGPGAVNVAMCESTMNPNAYNGALGASGLFQIIPSTFASTSYAGQSVFDPMVNIEAAHEIFARDGYSWREWSCQP